jgi:hypothetical protein
VRDAPKVELLWCQGCPSTDRALDELRAALADVGLGGTPIGLREIKTDADAQSEHFVGSPTILVDGVDVADGADHESAALTCRVYRRRDGRFSPTPDPEDVREALRTAVADEQVHADA